jgi:hypothetical protein
LLSREHTAGQIGYLNGANDFKSDLVQALLNKFCDIQRAKYMARTRKILEGDGHEECAVPRGAAQAAEEVTRGGRAAPKDFRLIAR